MSVRRWRVLTPTVRSGDHHRTAGADPRPRAAARLSPPIISALSGFCAVLSISAHVPGGAVNAIQLYRTLTGASLAEAKNAVDSVARGL